MKNSGIQDNKIWVNFQFHLWNARNTNYIIKTPPNYDNFKIVIKKQIK